MGKCKLTEVQEILLQLLNEMNASVETKFFALKLAEHERIGAELCIYIYDNNPSEQEVLGWIADTLEEVKKARR